MIPDEIWTADEVAERLNVSRELLITKLQHMVGFPKRLEYSIGGHPKWRAISICEWQVNKGDPHAVYRAYDKGGVLLYVGHSKFPHVRMWCHKQNSKWHKYLATYTCEEFPTKKAAAKAETHAIKTENPIYNKAHNNKMGRDYEEKHVSQ